MKPIQRDLTKDFSLMSDYRILSNCRICGGQFEEQTLMLSPTGLANELYDERIKAVEADQFPLEVAMCSECLHFQLNCIVSPKRLFSQYIYRSGTSRFFRDHFDSLALKIVRESTVSEPRVFEVGSNDGLLLDSLQKHGVFSVGVEPSQALVEECLNRGLNVIQGFLDELMVEAVLSKWGQFDYVVGNNVFAHIDDLLLAFKSVNKLLNPNGTFIFEVADFMQIKKKGIFDSIYHEHMSYHTLNGLKTLARDSGFTIVDFDYIQSHGGSFRFYLQKGFIASNSSKIEKQTQFEYYEGLTSSKVLTQIQDNIKERRSKVNRYIENLSDTDLLVGYGAPAKSVTFISEMNLQDSNILKIIDDNEWKQGKYLPVSGFKVTSQQEVVKLIESLVAPERIHFLIFPWNIGSDLAAKLGIWAPKRSKAVCFFPELEVLEL